MVKADMEKEPTTENQLKSDKRQTEVLIGISLVIIGVLIIFLAAYQPRTNSNVSLSQVSSSVYYSEAESSSSSSDSKVSSVEKDDSVIINLNICTAEDLMKLSGIGESKANAIIAYRNVIGSYSDTQEIKNISGISDKLYESIKDNLTV